MNDVRERWIEALESGRYPQGRDGLRDTQERFCCLGVLCDVLEPLGWEKAQFRYLHREGSYFPPVVLVHAAGITYEQSTALAFANDHGETFAQIAQRLRDGNFNLPGSYEDDE